MADRVKRRTKANSGKLRIGDHWNAITIIALSQSNPLKAVAEFVENSIDAGGREITIIRGRKNGRQYLEIRDDGEGIPLDGEGVPDFKHVATHICDSLKRKLKAEGERGIQGEFGIGLLSFWTVGENLELTSSGSDGKTWRMRMKKGSPDYRISRRRVLLPLQGTELVVYPLLPGIRQLTGEKIQRYLSSELRDRIRRTGVGITVVDRSARARFRVEPRQFSGRLLHGLKVPANSNGEVYLELYLKEPKADNEVGLFRRGTRVLPSLNQLDAFQKEPWNSGYLEGMIDAPMLSLTPGTRGGIVQDDAFHAFCIALDPVEEELRRIIEEQRRAEEEKASRQILKSIQRALREAILSLPREEYDWFDLQSGPGSRKGKSALTAGEGKEDFGSGPAGELRTEEEPAQKEFFQWAGPLFSVMISPRSSLVPVKKKKPFRALCRDRSRRVVEEGLEFSWEILEGEGSLDHSSGEMATFQAPEEPGLTQLGVRVSQGEISCSAEALITVTDSILPDSSGRTGKSKGLPGYTFKRAAGEDWRSRYEAEKNVIVINNGHRDFVYASKIRMRKLRYICRLFSKELVAMNFPGQTPDQLLEHMVELSLYTEENLK